MSSTIASVQTFRRSCYRAGSAGFTLMELVIVCLLAGIFLAFSIPTLRNNLLTGELDSSARKVIGTVRELRNLAVREHRPYLLHFDLGENRLWYELEGATDVFDDDPKPGLQLPEGVRFTEVRPASRENETSGEVVLWISRKGYMDRTAVYLSSDDGEELTLVFSPFSGSAQVYDGHVEAE